MRVAHRSRVVKDYVELLDGHLVLEHLPAYAPELNPSEYIWGYLKQRELANLCLHTIGDLGTFTRNRLKSMRKLSASRSSQCTPSRTSPGGTSSKYPDGVSDAPLRARWRTSGPRLESS
jgi:hypothetical protein